ncbi:hypothetical protein DQJ95_02135 [Salmonella enterica subsp. enterica serovar Muenster]|nr:hypothetical protein [Salmonella enterica subsp. enterica serovar Muenster]EBU8689391.1 hypothetical protein [Salmonella enterica subsp. enterica serovar Muenster]
MPGGGNTLPGLYSPVGLISVAPSGSPNCQKSKKLAEASFLKVAGVRGFEPRNAGIRIRCLTAWRYPNCRTSCAH